MTRWEQWGTDMRRGLCSKLNTDSGGCLPGGQGVFNCVCVCVDRSMKQWGPLTLKMASSESLRGKKNAFHSMTCYFRSTQVLCLPLLGLCACSQPHTVHTHHPGYPDPPTWTPHFKAFIYLVYHQRIWGIWWTISLLHPSMDEKKSWNRLKEKKETKQDVGGQFKADNPKSPSPLLPSSLLCIV